MDVKTPEGAALRPTLTRVRSAGFALLYEKNRCIAKTHTELQFEMTTHLQTLLLLTSEQRPHHGVHQRICLGRRVCMSRWERQTRRRTTGTRVSKRARSGVGSVMAVGKRRQQAEQRSKLSMLLLLLLVLPLLLQRGNGPGGRCLRCVLLLGEFA